MFETTTEILQTLGLIDIVLKPVKNDQNIKNFSKKLDSGITYTQYINND